MLLVVFLLVSFLVPSGDTEPAVAPQSPITKTITTTASATQESSSRPAAPSKSEVEKSITACAQPGSTYQSGTTWFSDGSTGWTEYCQKEFLSSDPATGVPCTEKGAISGTLICSGIKWEVNKGQFEYGFPGEPQIHPLCPADSPSTEFCIQYLKDNYPEQYGDSTAPAPSTKESSAPSLGDSCIGAEINNRVTGADGNALVCDKFIWSIDNGQVGSR